MPEYDNRNTFTLFKNNRKNKDTDADFSGTFTDKDGVEHWINGWSKTPKNGGDKFLSGNVRVKAQRDAPPPRARQAAPAQLDDDLPF